MSSFLQNIENFFIEGEADVQAVFADIVKGVEVVATDVEDGINWLEKQTPTITAAIQSVTGLLGQLPGVASNSTYLAAVKDANEAVAALNAAVAAQASGGSVAQQLVSGYVALKQAQAATANVASVAVTTAAANPAT